MTDQMHNAWPLPPMDELGDFARVVHTDAQLRQAAYAAHRRAYAEAIGRPYPEARHPVWPR